MECFVLDKQTDVFEYGGLPELLSNYVKVAVTVGMTGLGWFSILDDGFNPMRAV